MGPIYPKGEYLPFEGASGGQFVAGAPFRGVLHTTEAKNYTPSKTSYYGHTNPPHFTVVKKDGVAKVYQHYEGNKS